MTGSGDNDDNNNRTAGLLGIGLSATFLVVGAAAFAFWRRPPPSSNNRDMEGRVVCITGANVGIGRAVARQLVQRGAKIVMGCRNVEQGSQACETLGHDRCRVYPLDLASFESVESFSQSVANDSWIRTSNNTNNSGSSSIGGGGLHILINNAGAMIKEDEKTITMTRDQSQNTTTWDRSMVVNHLGWIQLTQNLLPILQRTAQQVNCPSRIVNVGSKLEKRAPLPTSLDDSNEWDVWMKESPNPYTPFQAYSKAKFAMTATTFYWAKQLSQPQNQQPANNIMMMLVSPGMVHTSLSRFIPLWKRVIAYPFQAMLLKTPEEGAETVVFAATATANDQIHTGKYYSECKEINDTDACSRQSQSPEIQQHIWEATLRALEERRSSSS